MSFYLDLDWFFKSTISKFHRVRSRFLYLKHIFVFLDINNQLRFTCSMSTIETLEKGVKYDKVNNKNTRTASMAFRGGIKRGYWPQTG